MNVLSLLGATLVLLKALGYIHLSWWACLAPFGLHLAFLVILFFIAALAAGSR